MYIVVITWFYIILVVAIAEATHINGSILSALLTFLFYGLLPIFLVIYIWKTPTRKKIKKQREMEASQNLSQADSAPPKT